MRAEDNQHPRRRTAFRELVTRALTGGSERFRRRLRRWPASCSATSADRSRGAMEGGVSAAGRGLAVGTVARDPFRGSPVAGHCLESAPAREGSVERFLTLVRSGLLQLAALPQTAAATDDALIRVACSLARQCFIDQYVFAAIEQRTGADRRTAQRIDLRWRRALPCPHMARCRRLPAAAPAASRRPRRCCSAPGRSAMKARARSRCRSRRSSANSRRRSRH